MALPGKDVEEYMAEKSLEFAEALKAKLLQVMNNAPSPDLQVAGLFATDIVDAALDALVEFTDTDMICDRIRENTELFGDLAGRNWDQVPKE